MNIKINSDFFLKNYECHAKSCHGVAKELLFSCQKLLITSNVTDNF